MDERLRRSSWTLSSTQSQLQLNDQRLDQPSTAHGKVAEAVEVGAEVRAEVRAEVAEVAEEVVAKVEVLDVDVAKAVALVLVGELANRRHRAAPLASVSPMTSQACKQDLQGMQTVIRIR